MKPSDFQKTVQCRFESCLKKVVRHVVKDYQKKLKRRQKEETLFCELPEIVVENLAVWDDYDMDYTIFNVCGSDIRICDDELAEALKHLSERNRENLLMYYFLEMSKKTKYFKKWCFSKPTQFTRAYEKNTKGEMIANETHNEEAGLLFVFTGNGRGRKSD